MQVEDGAAELVTLVLDALDVVDTTDVDSVELDAGAVVLAAADEEELLLPVDPIYGKSLISIIITNNLLRKL